MIEESDQLCPPVADVKTKGRSKSAAFLRLRLQKKFITPARPGRQEFVYVFLNRRDKICKIGWSAEPDRRALAIASGERLEVDEYRLIDTIPGNKRLETHLHRVFRHKRVRGEWFNLDSSDLTTIFGCHWGLEYYMKTSSQLLRESIAAFDALPLDEQISAMGPSHPEHPKHAEWKAWRREHYATID